MWRRLDGGTLDPLALRAAVVTEHALNGAPVILKQCPSGTWFHLRGVTTEALVRELESFAFKWQNDFWCVHSLRDGDISRIVLSASAPHLEELARNEGKGVVSRRPSAKTLATELSHTWALGEATVGEPLGGLEGSELARSVAGSHGQVWHMDTEENRRSMIVNLAPKGCELASTQIAVIPYLAHPQNISVESTVPAQWDDLQSFSVRWQRGDVIVMWENMVHRAPPNPGVVDRHLIFLSGGSLGGSSFSDTKVVTDAEFAKLRCVCVCVCVCVNV
jgi:hypothetical protein